MTEHTKTTITLVAFCALGAACSFLLWDATRPIIPRSEGAKAYVTDLQQQAPIPESIRATVANELADCLGVLIREPGMTFGMAVQVCFARMGLKRIWRVPEEKGKP